MAGSGEGSGISGGDLGRVKWWAPLDGELPLAGGAGAAAAAAAADSAEFALRFVSTFAAVVAGAAAAAAAAAAASRLMCAEPGDDTPEVLPLEGRFSMAGSGSRFEWWVLPETPAAPGGGPGTVCAFPSVSGDAEWDGADPAAVTGSGLDVDVAFNSPSCNFEVLRVNAGGSSRPSERGRVGPAW